MARYSSDWKKRVKISIIDPAGSASKDVEIAIPPELDEFWDVIDSAGAELRVVGPDGVTVLTYDIVQDSDDGTFDATSVTNKDGKIRIESMGLPSEVGCIAAHLIFDSVTTQGSASAAVSMGTPLTGYIEMGRPSWFVLKAERPIPGGVLPDKQLAKTSTDRVFVWVEFTGALEKAISLHASSPQHEEVLYALSTVLDTTGAQVATMIDNSELRIVEIGKRVWVKALIKAGTTATNYTLGVKIATVVPGSATVHRVIEFRYGLRIRDQLQEA